MLGVYIIIEISPASLVTLGYNTVDPATLQSVQGLINIHGCAVFVSSDLPHPLHGFVLSPSVESNPPPTFRESALANRRCRFQYYDDGSAA